MIAIAKAVSYGVNDLRYITGESNKKKHPEKIFRMHDNLLPSKMDAYGIWSAMQLHLGQYRKLKNSVITIRISPSRENTKHFNEDDWLKLWQDFVTEFDKPRMTDKNGKGVSVQTNIANSIHTVWLHHDAEGGVYHLHADVCRRDINGKTNDDSMIHERAQKAAERVVISRGWVTAAEIHNINKRQVSSDCYSVLKAMSKWSWEDYKIGITQKGYKVNELRDENDILRGYSIMKGHTKYKASDIGVGRNLTAGKLGRTWSRLHPEIEYSIREIPQSAKVQSATANHSPEQPEKVAEYTQRKPGFYAYELTHNGTDHRFYIPEKVLDLFNDEFDYRSVANWQELTHMAVAIFVGLIGGDEVAVTGGGGGTQSDLNWRDKNEDDFNWARRCARMAGRKLGIQSKNGLKR